MRDGGGPGQQPAPSSANLRSGAQRNFCACSDITRAQPSSTPSFAAIVRSGRIVVLLCSSCVWYARISARSYPSSASRYAAAAAGLPSKVSAGGGAGAGAGVRGARSRVGTAGATERARQHRASRVLEIDRLREVSHAPCVAVLGLAEVWQITGPMLAPTPAVQVARPAGVGIGAAGPGVGAAPAPAGAGAPPIVTAQQLPPESVRARRRAPSPWRCPPRRAPPRSRRRRSRRPPRRPASRPAPRSPSARLGRSPRRPAPRPAPAPPAQLGRRPRPAPPPRSSAASRGCR